MSEQTTKKTTTKKTTTKTTTSNEYANVHEAFFAFQTKQISVPRNTNGVIDGKQYMYADLEDINKVIVPKLISCGLTLSSIIENDHLITTLYHHKSGTHMKSSLHIGQPATPHEMGSRITHYRRYTIAALLNLVLDKPVTEEPQTQVEQTIAPVAPKVSTRMPQTQAPQAPSEGQNSPGFNKYYQNALNIIESSKHNPQALKLVKQQIIASPRLTSEETAELNKIIDAYINGK